MATGIVGTNALEQVLPRLGRADVMYRIATRTTFPSWGYQVHRGATTLWETWEDAPEKQMSLNMKMLGSTKKFFYHDLAGIRRTSPGWSAVSIRPQVVGDLKWVRAQVRTPRGVISVDWRRVSKGLNLKLVVPANVRAKLSLPTLGIEQPTIKESGLTAWDKERVVLGIAGMQTGYRERQYVTLELGNGRYAFTVR